ncbi:uncharacterized protein LOC6532026 [Drosophila yakuba]|uniref:uncharacterized protein LOC6532026 n=1 Tax=Drosophila yakuba TaxID=7245 RepID=UPI0019308918|nr:uncharacterized protein LOC6532026 [Drosophila yakuba]
MLANSERPTASRQLTLAGQRVGGGRTTYSSSGTSYGFCFISQLAGSYQRQHCENSGPLARDCILNAACKRDFLANRADHAPKSH